jgi:hypothetical protein
MMTMTLALNKASFGAQNRVTCYTCHRGSNNPLAAPTPTGQYTAVGVGVSSKATALRALEDRMRCCRNDFASTSPKRSHPFRPPNRSCPHTSMRSVASRRSGGLPRARSLRQRKCRPTCEPSAPPFMR